MLRFYTGEGPREVTGLSHRTSKGPTHGGSGYPRRLLQKEV